MWGGGDVRFLYGVYVDLHMSSRAVRFCGMAPARVAAWHSPKVGTNDKVPMHRRRRDWEGGGGGRHAGRSFPGVVEARLLVFFFLQTEVRLWVFAQ